jgi:hypothetical protein
MNSIGCGSSQSKSRLGSIRIPQPKSHYTEVSDTVPTALPLPFGVFDIALFTTSLAHVEEFGILYHRLNDGWIN